jgi:glycosyltransferase involved in cell wall biosynthesis
MQRRIVVLSEHYYPEESGTGYVLGRICEGLAPTHPVFVLCAYPPTDGADTLPPREVRNGVTIERCAGTRFDRNNLLLRSVNLVTLSVSMFFRAVQRLRRGDRVLVVTNPPSLPWFAFVACRIKGAECTLRIEDLYPEVLIPTGVVKAGGMVDRILNTVATWLLRRVERIIVLGRDMQRRVEQKLPPGDRRTVLITNWADVEEIVPMPREENELLHRLGISDKFVLQNSGNMQRSMGFEVLLEAMRQLNGREDIHLLFIGKGARKEWLLKEVNRLKLSNIAVLPSQPRRELNTLLNACDVAVISMIPGMSGISIPSRMYNCMAAGKPILAITDEESELALVVRENHIGWVVPPNDPSRVVEAIMDGRTNRDRTLAMGRRAREVAEQQFPFERILQSYRELYADC